MGKATRFVGLDVHADMIAVAVAEDGRDGEIRSLGRIPNRAEPVRKLIKKLGGPRGLKVCYEAGPTGYALYWQLVGLGVACEVIAPTLVPTKAGDRVKTDRRDAVKLARCHRAGELTAVWVPDAKHEALRDLVRAREAAKKDQLRARHRLAKFLLRHGRRQAEKVKGWTGKHLQWVRAQVFEERPQQVVFEDYLAEVDHASGRIERLERAIDEAIEQLPDEMRAVVDALQALRGVARMTAVTVVAETGRLSRFARPKHLMGYSGLVPSEYSTGGDAKRGHITKTGNAHLRRVLVEAAWSYRSRPSVGDKLRKRQEGLSAPLVEMAWKAQQRLHRRYYALALKGKAKQHVVTAVARELLGFMWAVGVEAERQHALRTGHSASFVGGRTRSGRSYDRAAPVPDARGAKSVGATGAEGCQGKGTVVHSGRRGNGSAAAEVVASGGRRRRPARVDAVSAGA